MPDKILVRCRRTGRLGRIDGFMDPPRSGGRSVIVVWQGKLEYSVVRHEELTLAPEATIEEWQRPPNPSIAKWPITPQGAPL